MKLHLPLRLRRQVLRHLLILRPNSITDWILISVALMFFVEGIVKCFKV